MYFIKYFRRISVKSNNKDLARTCEYYSNQEVSTRGHCAFITNNDGDVHISPAREMTSDAPGSSQIYTNTVGQVSDRYTDLPCKGTETRKETIANCSKDFEHDNIY